MLTQIYKILLLKENLKLCSADDKSANYDLDEIENEDTSDELVAEDNREVMNHKNKKIDKYDSSLIDYASYYSNDFSLGHYLNNIIQIDE